VDLTVNTPNANSPIPSGKQIRIGFVTIIAGSKSATCELRPNLPTKSAANTTDTQLRDFAFVPSDDSAIIDAYYNDALVTLAPVTVASTGVEKLWLRLTSVSSASATFSYIINYTLV
jgi:hypothetical protein